MSLIRYPASPLAHWLDLQKTHHVTATQLVHWLADCCLATSCNILPIVACAYRGMSIEPLVSNALSKPVKINNFERWFCFRHHIKFENTSFQFSRPSLSLFAGELISKINLNINGAQNLRRTTRYLTLCLFAIAIKVFKLDRCRIYHKYNCNFVKYFYGNEWSSVTL
jgi:hypothetical protein